MREAICLVQLRKSKPELVGMARRSARATVRAAFLECGDLPPDADLSIDSKPDWEVDNVSARAVSPAPQLIRPRYLCRTTLANGLCAVLEI